MGSIHELVELAGRVRERFRDPRKKERAELASRFRGKVKGLLGNRSQKTFLLTGEETAKLGSDKLNGSATVEVRREWYGFRFAIMTGEYGEVIELHGNSPRIIGTSYIGENSGRIPVPTGVNPLDQEIEWLKEWTGIAIRLEGLQRKPQIASSAPVAP